MRQQENRANDSNNHRSEDGKFNKRTSRSNDKSFKSEKSFNKKQEVKSSFRDNNDNSSKRRPEKNFGNDRPKAKSFNNNDSNSSTREFSKRSDQNFGSNNIKPKQPFFNDDEDFIERKSDRSFGLEKPRTKQFPIEGYDNNFTSKKIMKKSDKNFGGGKVKQSFRKNYDNDFSDGKSISKRTKGFNDKPKNKQAFKGRNLNSFLDDDYSARKGGSNNKSEKGFIENKANSKSFFKKSNEGKFEQKGIRLNRFISNSGVCSRRDADKLITDREVSVNGKIITEMGARVNLYDDVRLNGKRIIAEKKVYLLLNKPKGFVTTLEDPHADKTVMDLVRGACQERIYPIGRLDKATTGLLLFTNDGDLAKKLTHPSHNKRKIYHVFLNEKFPEENIEKISKGIQLEDGIIKADSISYVDINDKTQIGIEIHSGKNRIVRRIFEHFGFKVQKLDRVFFAGLTKKNLPRGKYRFLTDKEISYLKMN